MSATMSTTHKAMDACQRCAQRMPFSCSEKSAMYTMYMMAASTLIIGTGAIASVSLFGVVLLVALLLVSLVVVISLLLTRLTGPISLEGLVGQTKETAGLATHMTRGE